MALSLRSNCHCRAGTMTDTANSRGSIAARRVRALLPWLGLVWSTGSCLAADINGAWVTDTAACDKVFVKNGGQLHLSGDADIYGSGFVVDGSTVRGKIATCKVTSRKDDGVTIHLQAAC